MAPRLVDGGLPLSEQRIVTNAEGESLDYREGKKYPPQPQYALCLCRRAQNPIVRSGYSNLVASPFLFSWPSGCAWLRHLLV